MSHPLTLKLPADWRFFNPVPIRFGEGCVESCAREDRRGQALLVTSPGMVRRGTAQRVREVWGATRLTAVLPNPELRALDEAAAQMRGAGIDRVVALGGGSVIDSAKVFALLLAGPADFSLAGHFREGQPLPGTRALPVVAIPTTAGTGSEVTPFATVWDTSSARKFSLSDPALYPAQALLDPQLTYDLPWDVTLSTALDALCQAMESVWNRNANPVTLGLSFRAAELAWGTLAEGRKILTSPELRRRQLEASLCAGVAISHTRTALCHSMSYPITARLGVPHGLACGFLLPAVLAYNRAEDDGRLAALARALGCGDAVELERQLETLLVRLGVPAAVGAHLGDPAGLLALAPEMITPGRSDNNWRAVDVSAIESLLAGYLPRFLASFAE